MDPDTEDELKRERDQAKASEEWLRGILVMLARAGGHTLFRVHEMMKEIEEELDLSD